MACSGETGRLARTSLVPTSREMTPRARVRVLMVVAPEEEEKTPRGRRGPTPMSDTRQEARVAPLDISPRGVRGGGACSDPHARAGTRFGKDAPGARNRASAARSAEPRADVGDVVVRVGAGSRSTRGTLAGGEARNQQVASSARKRRRRAIAAGVLSVFGVWSK